MFTWLADKVIEYRRWILLAMLALAAVFATTVPDLGFDFTPQQMFQSTSSANAYREQFAERFGREDNLVTVAVIGDDLFRPHVLETMRDLTVELRQLESIKNAESIATFEIPRSGDAPGTLTTAPILAPRGRVDPQAAKSLETLALSEPLVRERLVSKGGDMALVVAWIRDDLQDADELKGAVEAIEATLSEHALPEGFEYRTGGIPTLRTQIVDQLRTEQLTFLPLTGLVYLFILIWLFRRLSGVLLPLVTVSFAVLATIATLVWTNSPINIVNNVLPSLIFVIGISDSIHMLARDAEEIEAGKGRIAATKAMIRHTGLACLLTSCTTAVGFISLLAADSSILQNFGWQAAVGVMFAYVATIFFLPAALAFMKPVKRKKKREDDKLHGGAMLERFLVSSGEVLLRHAKAVVVSSLLITAGFATLASRVDIDTTLLEVFHEDHPSYQTTELIEEHLGGFLPVEISLEADEKDRFKDPAVYANIACFQAFAEEQPEVLSTQSLVDFHQSTRAALLGDPAERETMPESRAQVEQLHLMIAGAPDEPTGINRFVTADFRNTRVLVRVADVGAKAQMKLARRLEDKLSGLFGEESGVRFRLTGDAYVASVALDSFIRDLFYSLLVAIVIIFGMMTVVFRSVKLGLVSMLPNTIPLVMTFGYMGLMGINLNTTTIIIFAISLGLAVDDTIHFLARFREEIGQRETAKEAILYSYYGAGRAILLTSVLLVTGLTVLLVSDFVPTRQFGILTSITIGGAVFGDLILLPSLLYLLYRRDDERSAGLTSQSDAWFPIVHGARGNLPNAHLQTMIGGDMKAVNLMNTGIALLLLATMSGCAGCEDEFATGCTSDEDCRVGRMCIEEACAPARDSGTPLDDEDAGPQNPNNSDGNRVDSGDSSPSSGTPSDQMVREYCDTEAACIPICVVQGGEAACDSNQRQTECREDFAGWYERLTGQSTRCAQTIDAWVECISAASCGDVEEFFRAHPDGVTDATPCASEFFKMECTDFEPVTEYGF